MVNPSKKGDRAERELVNMFDNENWGSIRVPASGGATLRELPDIHVGNGEESYAMECKAAKGGSIYLSWEEVFDLLVFSNLFGSKARIAVRYNRKPWRFYHPSQLHRTKSGSRRVDEETDVEHETFEDILEQ